MNRTYEIMFIVRPDVEEAELDKLIEGFSANVTNGGGEVKSVEKMGRRRLAYTVRKFNDGFYVLLNVAAAGSLITEIERRLRVSEQVIKFITVRMDEEEKRLAKVKAIRDTKVKRSAQPIAAPVQAPAAAPDADAAKAETEEEKKPVAAAPAEHVAIRRAARDCLRSGLTSDFAINICDEAETASHNASRSPNFASTRSHSVGCSETPSRVWSEERHNVPEREISWLTKPARNPLSSTHHTSRPAHSGPGAGPRTPRPAGAPGGGPGGRKFFRRKKVCKFCTEKIDAISYRDVRLLQGFVAERGKIVPRRLTGVCTRHQRKLSLAIKQSRNIALLAFAARF